MENQCIVFYPDFLQQTESHYTHFSEHRFLDSWTGRSFISGFLPVSNVIQLICVKENFLRLAQAFVFIICSFNHLISVSLQLNLCLFINDSLRKTSLSLFLQGLYLQWLMTWWLTVSNTYIWHYFATELLKLGRPCHRNNTVAFFFLQILPLEAFACPHPSVFLLCRLFLAETCIKLNIEKAQCLKGLGEMPETTEIEQKYMCEPSTRADAESIPLFCKSKGMDVRTS